MANKSNDIVERLMARMRGRRQRHGIEYEAADEIERLRAQLAQAEALLREAREPLSKVMRSCTQDEHFAWVKASVESVARIDAFLTPPAAQAPRPGE